MTDNVINIVMASSNEYAVHCGTLMISILKNSLPNEFFHFYILETNICDENKRLLEKIQTEASKIDFIRLDKDIFSAAHFTKKYSSMPQVTVQTFYKYLIPILLKDIDRVLYMDVDTLVFNSLSSFYNTDFKDNYAAVVSNYDCYKGEDLGLNEYFNAGVVLFNLKKCREENITDQLFKNHIELFDAGKLKFVDQCVLNYTFRGQVVWCDMKYNVGTQWVKKHERVCKNAVKNAVITHFTTVKKPWDLFFAHPYAEKYFEYLQLSPFNTERKGLMSKYKNHKKNKIKKKIKTMMNFVKSYFLFPWYIYKMYQMLKEKGVN